MGLLSVYQERVGSKSCSWVDEKEEANMDMSVDVGIDQALRMVSDREGVGDTVNAWLRANIVIANIKALRKCSWNCIVRVYWGVTGLLFCLNYEL